MTQLGDYVAQKHPNEAYFLKKGIVVSSTKDSFMIQWLSYNKNFFMEIEGAAFEELNRRYLLKRMSYSRKNNRADIVILSKAGENGVG